MRIHCESIARIMKVIISLAIVYMALCAMIASGSDTKPENVAAINVDCDAKTIECLQSYVKEKMNAEDINQYLRDGRACFSRDKEQLQKEAFCFLPLKLGTDTRNGQTLELKYFCSDVCPKYGGIIIDYVGVKKEDCCKVGGYPKHDSAFGGYIGCQPKEVPLPQYFLPDKDGVLRLGVRNSCNPSEVTIIGDIPQDWRNR